MALPSIQAVFIRPTRLYNADMPQTTETKARGPRRPARVGLLTAILLIVGGGILVGTRVPTWLRMRELKSSDAKVRRAAVRELGGREGYAAIPAIREMITADPDPDVRAAAAHAAMRLGDAPAAEAVRQIIQTQPDQETTAELLATLARLCSPTADATAFVDACALSGKPYRVAGAALARAEWFQPRGVEELLALAKSGPEEIRPFARDRLHQYLIPAGEMVGVNFDTTDPWPAERFEAMRSWWRTHGTARLLEDALRTKRSREPDVNEIQRLQHARERVGRKLGLL